MPSATASRKSLLLAVMRQTVCPAGSGAVGPTGRVIGVDLAENLLTLAREKANRRALGNVEFRQGDMTALGYPNGTFDAVICVFGTFFVANHEKQHFVPQSFT